MPGWLWVAIGGATGAVCRHAVNHITAGEKGALIATLLVNVGGCFLIGFFAHWFSTQASEFWPAHARLLLATGFCGAFTTMSALALETYHLWDDGQPMASIGYLVANGALSVLALVVGLAAARSVLA
ncbi:MAG: fluoride efflux transporter CrcB [Pseudomonadota bacterium]